MPDKIIIFSKIKMVIKQNESYNYMICLEEVMSELVFFLIANVIAGIVTFIKC